ncbi:MAG TPA: caspase family protein, partial [Burkholderiales bacterium]|nr:caspase family protein [Burkholderiales bacterium]
MWNILTRLLALCALIFLLASRALSAEPTETRIALVVGNAAYQAGPLQTAANDAGLIAQTLQAAAFDVIGARDLDQEGLRRAFRDFLDKASASGPDTVAVIYLSGYALQLEGENYFLPIDAKIARDTDVIAEGVRLSDYLRSLAGLQLKASVVVVDGARKLPFAISGQPLASGLALVEPPAGTLVAFNATPGTVAPEQNGPYGIYAQALAEMMRDAGLPIGEVFDRVRLRVSDVAKGAQLPWSASKLATSFVFFERAPDAPPVVSEQNAPARTRGIAELSPPDAYASAVERDNLNGYEEFLSVYGGDPL